MDGNQLPREFLLKMKELLGNEFENYIESFKEEKVSALRINHQKISTSEFEKIAPFSLKPIPFVANGYIYPEEIRPSKDPYYYAGLYYLQEPSAMMPASLLPVTPGDKVLDLCAAPGGKSTELGVRLEGKGLLFSNDISNSRAKALLKNLELFGISNFCVTSEAPDKLQEYFPEYFDKILVDAPCSGEGMFRKDDSMIRDWLERGPDYYSPIQMSILESAAAMLKPGGLLLYSTCTFDQSEDEDVIESLLKHHPELSLVPLPKKEGFADGFGLEGCIRLFPHKIQGEGHFMALLKKEGEPEHRPAVKGAGKISMPPAVTEFLSLISREFSCDRIMIKENMVYYLPDEFSVISKLRYLRTGLLLGELKKDRFEPSQALAMALKKEEFYTVLDLSRNDDRVIRYLKGETISLDQEIKGWCLVCVDGFPLGFGKGAGHMLKNKYYQGWRWQ